MGPEGCWLPCLDLAGGYRERSQAAVIDGQVLDPLHKPFSRKKFPAGRDAQVQSHYTMKIGNVNPPIYANFQIAPAPGGLDPARTMTQPTLWSFTSSKMARASPGIRNPQLGYKPLVEAFSSMVVC
jgi:hypothetical protein